MSPYVISPKDITAAAQRIQGVAVRTPLITAHAIGERLGGSVYIKPECLQRTGSFKFRGAYNRLSQLSPAQRQAGVVAWSSGNHAQGIAAAAKLLGIQASIIMPEDAPRTKQEGTQALGAEIVPYDRYTQSREDIARTLCAERGATLVPSYDDPHIIAGQGTTGLEIAQQLSAMGEQADQLLVCCGGGGLAAGIATALSAEPHFPDIYSVEPDGFDDTARSLQSGQREQISPDARSICDALLSPTPGELTLPINKQLLAGGLAVSEEAVKNAMRTAFHDLKLVVEPGGAVALAALLDGKIEAAGKVTVVIISGGNVDPDLFVSILQQ